MTAQEFSARVLEVEEMLYRVAYGILLNQSDCADAVQDALLRAWEKLHTLREEEYFRTWLVRILINQCYTLLRRRRFFLPLDSARTVAAPEGADPDLHDAIARLDDKLLFGGRNFVHAGRSFGNGQNPSFEGTQSPSAGADRGR